MKRNPIVGLLFLVVACISLSLIACQSSPPAAACKDEPFTYDNGPLGQSHWCGECNSEASTTQAPINIRTNEARPDGSLPVLDFSGYKTTKLVTSKDAHNLKVSYQGGESFLTIGGKPFKLTEFHFHRPGEEAVDNHRPAMVIHLVHNNVEPVVPGGAIAIAVMVEEGKPNSNTEALVNKLIQYFPPPDGRQGGDPGVDINAADLLPAGSLRSSYYRYTGTLTTPACGGPVEFYVLKTPIFFSAEQIRQFERRYPFPNARNIQPTNGRSVVQTITK